MSNLIQPVKGTVDYYPEAMALRSWLYGKIREVSESFGYSEYEAPFLERLELYAAKSGEELVEKQSYVFSDRSGERITLRPELTPSLARMVAAKQRQLNYPLRWWSFGPFWRYERPQKGRSREFFQWNIDLIGAESAEADAEIVAIAATFLKNLGLQASEAMILVNHRELMQSEILKIGFDENQLESVYKLIDRKEKLPEEKWKNYAKELSISGKLITALEGLLANNELWKKSEDLQAFFENIESMGLSEYVKFAPHVIRGLDYYTGIVFEAWDTAGEFRSIFGGGRYDDLVNQVGGEPVPAVGFAAGNMVLSLMLKKLGHAPEHKETPAEVYVTLFNEDTLAASLDLAQTIRMAGIKVVSHLETDKLQKQFKRADRLGASFVLILGPDEISSGKVSAKNLGSGEQFDADQKEIVALLKAHLTK
jgi:histidyl-tRNA synthetase